jgi:phosphoadenosine phosphosulfate reductase
LTSRKKSKAPYFGKIRLFWCDDCQATLINEKCPGCGKSAPQVNVAPPGDIRPAFSGDWQKILASIEMYFGNHAAESLKPFFNSLVLLNKAPHEDRLDEIIINGRLVGIIKYDLLNGNHILIPRPEMAELMDKTSCESIIELKPGTFRFLKKNSSILIPGIKNMDSRIKKDFPVIIRESGIVVATGVACIDGNDFSKMNYGKAAKIKYLAKIPVSRLIPENREKFIENNQSFIIQMQDKAISFIKKAATRSSGKNLVSYSGGKDSLVTSYLVFLALVNNFDLIFVDTGFEFEETIKNVSNFSQFILRGEINRFHSKKANNGYFWEMITKFGPPSRDSRYCCKKSKLTPINQLLEEFYPDQDVLTFIGRRKYESYDRAFEPTISRNRWVPRQLSAAPIKSWNALEVYLFIWIHHLEIYLNPLYEAGLTRVGCWLCPASNMADFQIVKSIMPGKYKKLIDHIETWGKKQGFPQEWVTLGLWRWKKLPQKINRYLERQKITIDKNKGEKNARIDFEMTNVLSPCKKEQFIVIQVNRGLVIDNLRRLVSLVGREVPTPSPSMLKAVNKRRNARRNYSVTYYDSGAIKIRSSGADILNSLVNIVMATIIRSHECTGCRTCINHCKDNYISFSEESLMIEDSCTNCGKCTKFCPIIKYFYQDMDKKVNTILDQKLMKSG